MEDLDEMLSYAPDSPLFVRQLSMYSSNLERLGDFMTTMIKMMRQFQKDSTALAKSASELGKFMRSGLGQSETNAHLLPYIKKFGEIFIEIGNSQEILSESLESTFSQPLEKFCKQDIASLNQLKASYTSLRDAGESSIQRYLQSDVSNFGRGASQGSLEQKAYDLVLHKRNFELSRFDLVCKINEIESRKSLEISEACVSGMYALRSHHRICENRFNSCDSYMSQLQKCQEDEKEKLVSVMKPLEKKRRDVAAVLNAMVERVEMASSFLSNVDNSNEGTSKVTETGGINSGGKDRISLSKQDEKRTSSPAPASSFSSLSRMGYNFIGGLTKNINSMNVVGDRDRGGRNGSVSSSTWGTSNNNSGLTAMTMESRGGGGWRGSMSTSDGLDGTVMGDASQLDTCENCEARMKALDSTELSPFYYTSAAVAPAGLVKQGYLWKRSDKQKLIENWKRQWFVLDETKLYFIKERPADGYNTFQVQTVCDLMLASVREVTDIDLPFCFRVSNANVDSIVVQAEGQKEYQLWLKELRNAIEKRLTSGQTAMHTSPKTLLDSGLTQQDSSISLLELEKSEQMATQREVNSSIIANILKHNPRCAECDRSDPPPVWVSINLGCVVCIECSGVHRAMGVHISKMRSLKLDDLEPEEYETLELLGNEKNINVWECKLPPNFRKPTPSSSYSVRDRYIRDKYELKKFVDASDNIDIEECSHEVIRACEEDDVILLYKNICIGGPHCFLTRGTFPLHVAAKRNASSCCMLLLVSGCSVLEKNKDDLKPSEVALVAGNVELSSFLIDREDHVLATRSRSTSQSSMGCSPTNNLNLDFDDNKEDHEYVRNMLNKSLSYSNEDFDPPPMIDNKLVSSEGRNTTNVDNLTE